jgi:hypothetical protein
MLNSSKYRRTLLPFVLLAIAFSSSGCREKSPTITGHVNLSAELQKTLKPTAVLYIIARHSGETAGPPVAVKRFPQPILFPVDFTLSAQDAMMPDTPFEGKLAITARVSQSGSATPVNPGDIEGRIPGETAVGSENMQLDLNQVKP